MSVAVVTSERNANMITREEQTAWNRFRQSLKRLFTVPRVRIVRR